MRSIKTINPRVSLWEPKKRQRTGIKEEKDGETPPTWMLTEPQSILTSMGASARQSKDANQNEILLPSQEIDCIQGCNNHEYHMPHDLRRKKFDMEPITDKELEHTGYREEHDGLGDCPNIDMQGQSRTHIHQHCSTYCLLWQPERLHLPMNEVTNQTALFFGVEPHSFARVSPVSSSNRKRRLRKGQRSSSNSVFLRSVFFVFLLPMGIHAINNNANNMAPGFWRNFPRCVSAIVTTQTWTRYVPSPKIWSSVQGALLEFFTAQHWTGTVMAGLEISLPVTQWESSLSLSDIGKYILVCSWALSWLWYTFLHYKRLLKQQTEQKPSRIALQPAGAYLLKIFAGIFSALALYMGVKRQDSSGQELVVVLSLAATLGAIVLSIDWTERDLRCATIGGDLELGGAQSSSLS